MAKTEEKRIKFTIPKIPGTSNDDWVCWLNGRRFQIRRGAEVEVPEGVAEIYYASIRAEEQAEEYEEAARGRIGG